MSSLRRSLYRASRTLGDMEAAERGPKVLGRRLVRRRVYREQGRLTRKILRGFGL